MPLLFVASDLLGYGGIQLFGRLALRAVCDVFPGEVSVISRADSPESLAASGIDCAVIPTGKSSLRFAASLVRALRDPWDAVIFMHVNLARVLPISKDRRSLVIFHGIEVWKPFSWLVGCGCRRASLLLANSNHTIRRAQEINPWLANNSTAVCHLGIPDTEQPDKTDISNPYILSIGRMVSSERYKGFDELIGAWPAVRLQRPEMRLVLMGDGIDRPRLEEFARRQGPGIEFTGKVDDATRDRYLRQCTAFALPSRAEGFGLVYLEAMRVGRPVLTGNSDAGMEVIVDRQTGRAVDPTKPESLVDGLLDVSGPNALQYGRAGRERYLSLFTYEHFRERFVAVVRKLIRG